jgi:hypothetical protein
VDKHRKLGVRKHKLENNVEDDGDAWLFVSMQLFMPEYDGHIVSKIINGKAGSSYKDFRLSRNITLWPPIVG